MSASYSVLKVIPMLKKLKTITLATFLVLGTAKRGSTAGGTHLIEHCSSVVSIF